MIPRKRHPTARLPQTDIGRRIRARREEFRLSQGELARKIGVLQPVISQWELGDHRPRGQKLERLARALDTTPEWIEGGA